MVTDLAELVQRLTGATPEAALNAVAGRQDHSAPWAKVLRHGWDAAERHDDPTVDDDPFADLGDNW
ncbi:hypothetical protein DVS28_b0555 (plasmid) [Euzebya pacifica]|uniref:Uncharacterized protein n=1 Tax=Euzebya pacifica TaxID=1608957 RepID=A0A346Y748_9ACTN|nr:hypothetical protein [Euzebya pacifica]AXV10295.1 hypothetical protein DVS28_b0555 [Euzebya pacifica]